MSPKVEKRKSAIECRSGIGLSDNCLTTTSTPYHRTFSVSPLQPNTRVCHTSAHLRRISVLGVPHRLLYLVTNLTRHTDPHCNRKRGTGQCTRQTPSSGVLQQSSPFQKTWSNCSLILLITSILFFLVNATSATKHSGKFVSSGDNWLWQLRQKMKTIFGLRQLILIYDLIEVDKERYWLSWQLAGHRKRQNWLMSIIDNRRSDLPMTMGISTHSTRSRCRVDWCDWIKLKD